MKNGFFMCLTALLAGGGMALGQSATSSPAPPAASPATAAVAAPAVPAVDDPWDDPDSDSGPRLWASGEYLLWWIKRGPVSVPLLTTNTNPATIAALNEPGTQIQFGAGSSRGLDYDPFSGCRVTVGALLGDDVGIEASGFLLERRPVALGISTPGGATGLVVAFPLNAVVPFPGNAAGETSFNSGGAPGTFAVQSSSQLWGTEANGVLNIADTADFRWQLLVGFRYVDLDEDLRLTGGLTDAATGGSFTVRDAFATRDQFYGGQIGTRFGLNFGRLTAEASAKVALGSMQEVLSIAGNTVVTNGAFGLPTGTFAGGVFAEPSNIGRFRHDAFAAVPEASVRVGFALTRSLTGFVGYDFLYASDVLRPGNQIDRNINVNQNGLSGSGQILSPAEPRPLLNRSDFWAQGISFGLELRF